MTSDIILAVPCLDRCIAVWHVNLEKMKCHSYEFMYSVVKDYQRDENGVEEEK